MNPASAPPQLDALTGLRGLAAWAVVLYHVRLSCAALLPAPAIAALGKGYLAVDLFFMLSGFVLAYTYGARLRERGLAAAPGFLWRRFARIWPLHAAILTAFVILAAALQLSGRDSAGYPFAELPLHFALMQNWGFTTALTWNDPAWSISTELAAYLVFPFAAVALRRTALSTPALVMLLALLLAALNALFAAHGHARLGEGIPQLGLWRCLAEFACGAILHALWRRWREVPRAAGWSALALLGILAAGLGLGLAETAFVPAALAAGLLALALAGGVVARTFAAPPLRTLGEISYSTYLVHVLLFTLYKLAFVDPSLQLGWGGLAGFLALVLAASLVLYHGLEKPAQRWLNARGPGLPQGLAAAAR